MTAAASVLGFIQFGIAATWLLNVSQAVASTRILAAEIARYITSVSLTKPASHTSWLCALTR
jgi:hypothetical protein